MAFPEARNFHDAINLLGGSLAAAGRQREIQAGTNQRAQFEIIFGYSMLTLNEARALWSLVSCGLETQGFIHLRTIIEHAARNTILMNDAAFARRIYDSLGASERDLIEDFVIGDPEIQSAVERGFSPVIESKPDRRIIPNMRDAIERVKLGPINYGVYRVLSQTAHGTVIALRNLANVTNRIDRDFIAQSALSKMRSFQLFLGSYLLLATISALSYVSDSDINNEYMRISDANVALRTANMEASLE